MCRSRQLFSIDLFTYYFLFRRGRGGSSEISPPLLRSSGLSKNLYCPPHLMSIFLPTGFYAISLLEILCYLFSAFIFLLFLELMLSFQYGPSIACFAEYCYILYVVKELVNLLCRAYCNNIFAQVGQELGNVQCTYLVI